MEHIELIKNIEARWYNRKNKKNMRKCQRAVMRLEQDIQMQSTK